MLSLFTDLRYCRNDLPLTVCKVVTLDPFSVILVVKVFNRGVTEFFPLRESVLNDALIVWAKPL